MWIIEGRATAACRNTQDPRQVMTLLSEQTFIRSRYSLLRHCNNALEGAISHRLPGYCVFRSNEQAGFHPYAVMAIKPVTGQSKSMSLHTSRSWARCCIGAFRCRQPLLSLPLASGLPS